MGDAGVAPEPMPQVVLEKNGAPLEGGEGFAVKFQKKRCGTSFANVTTRRFP